MLPEKWVTGSCPEVLNYLNKKYNFFLNDSWKYYGENKNKCVIFDSFNQINKDYTLLTTEQFLEMTTEQEVWKKGDIIYTEKHNLYREIHLILQNIVFTTCVEKTIEDLEVKSVIMNTKDYLIEEGYKLFNKEKNKTVELTLEEIAQKFNVDVKDLKIKK